MKSSFNKSGLSYAFSVFDEDDDGIITCDDLRKIMKNLGDQISVGEINDLCKAFDEDGDGQVTKDEFLRYMLNKWAQIKFNFISFT